MQFREKIKRKFREKKTDNTIKHKFREKLPIILKKFCKIITKKLLKLKTTFRELKTYFKEYTSRKHSL